MDEATGIAGIIEINKLLHVHINVAIIERINYTNDPSDKMLSILSTVFENNEKELGGLIDGFVWPGSSDHNTFLSEWKKVVLFQDITQNAPIMLAVEYLVSAALEAYKTLLNTTSFISCTNRSVLMDQKYFFQTFLIDIVKCRKLNMKLAELVLAV